jgi:hypothetical protein
MLRTSNNALVFALSGAPIHSHKKRNSSIFHRSLKSHLHAKIAIEAMKKGLGEGQFHQPVLYVSLCVLIGQQHGVIRALKCGATVHHHPPALGEVQSLLDQVVSAIDGV